MEEDRELSLKWAESKLKNPKRSTLKPEPWEEVSEGLYRCKFSWNEDKKPPVVDSEGTHITDENTFLFMVGLVVNFAFKQKPYILKDGVTYGTSLKLVGVQVVSLGLSRCWSTLGTLVDDVPLFSVTQLGIKLVKPSVVRMWIVLWRMTTFRSGLEEACCDSFR